MGSKEWRQELLVKPDDKDEDLTDHGCKNRQSGVSVRSCFAGPVFGRRGDNTLQSPAYFFYYFLSIGKGKLVVAGIDKKAVQLRGSRYLCVELMFLQAPGFLQQPAYPVTLYGLAQPLFGNTETYAHGRWFRFAPLGQVLVYHPQRENRKRLSGLEKRFNLFTQLQPFDCLQRAPLMNTGSTQE